MIKFCHQQLPGTVLTAVELDPHVIALREAFFLPPDSERLQILTGDGRAYLANSVECFDLLLLDAFSPNGLASGFADRSFFASAYASLSQQGILVINLAGERESFSKLIDEVLHVFDDRALLLPVPEDGNFVLFAFRDSGFEPRWRWLHRFARELRAIHGLDFPDFAQKLELAAKRNPLRRW